MNSSQNNNNNTPDSAPAPLQKPGKRLSQPPKKRRGCSVGLIAAIVVLCGLALALRLYIRPPENSGNTPPTGNQATIPSAHMETTKPGKTQKNAYTVILAGQREGMTDTLMVAMLDLDAKQANVVSIPRDTLVACKRSLPKINGAYTAGDSGELGMEQLKKEISTLIGYTPANWALVNMKGFEALVDAIGGVQFDVPVRMYIKWEGINLEAGPQKLSGKKALQLMRFRGYGSSSTSAAGKAGIDHDDYGRMQVQQMFLKALIDQTLTADNIKQIPTFLDIAGKNLQSDMDAGNMAWFAQQLYKLGPDKITFSTLPTRSIKYGDDKIMSNYYEVVDTEAALKMINEKINPFTFDITAGMVEHLDPEPQ